MSSKPFWHFATSLKHITAPAMIRRVSSSFGIRVQLVAIIKKRSRSPPHSGGPSIHPVGDSLRLDALDDLDDVEIDILFASDPEASFLHISDRIAIQIGPQPPG
jgi:hypothetical protein